MHRLTDSYPRLLADIGGTNARFGWQAAPGRGAAHEATVSVSEHGDLVGAARQYLARLSAGGAPLQPRTAAFAVATAVREDCVRFTNSPWSFSQEAVRQALGLQVLRVVNDFEALALSLPGLVPGQMQGFPGGPRTPVPGLTLAVVGPGTGLGVGAVVPSVAGRWDALPGEGGHATLAPQDDAQGAVLAVLRQEMPHVSAERVLSGIGLPNLHRALAQVQGEALPEAGQAPDAEQIVRAGLLGEPAASRTLDAFCAMLGGFCGNVALTYGARGGLFLGGGILPRMAQRLFSSRFRECFEAKGRFHDYLQGIPTFLITDTLVGLSGAAAALDQSLAA